MTSEEYAEIFNNAKFSMLASFPDGKLPLDETECAAAITKLRAHRAILEKLALVKKIESQALYALEAEMLAGADEATIKKLRKREASGDGAGKVTFNRDKRTDAVDKLIAAGFTEDAARLMLKNITAGAKK